MNPLLRVQNTHIILNYILQYYEMDQEVFFIQNYCFGKKQKQVKLILTISKNRIIAVRFIKGAMKPCVLKSFIEDQMP